MTCDDVRSGYLAGGETPETEAHLRGCASCRQDRPRLDQLRALLREPAVWEEPSPDLGLQVSAAVQAAARRAAPGRRPRAPARPSVRRRWRVALVGVAAAVLAVLGALALVGRPNGPDWQLALQPTASAPGASATISGWNDETGTRLELDVAGLAPSGPDAYYAIWLTSPDGRHVPAGTFRAPGTVAAWAGVSRQDFPRVWITLEPADQDESLSGPTVLDTATY